MAHHTFDYPLVFEGEERNVMRSERDAAVTMRNALEHMSEDPDDWQVSGLVTLLFVSVEPGDTYTDPKGHGMFRSSAWVVSGRASAEDIFKHYAPKER